MNFSYPIGLLALAGLIIPLIIHLWNVKQGKTLKIGSIALLGESSRASSKSFKINDWFLLLLRCLLIILTTFILAQPFIKKKLEDKNSGWILVEKSKFQKAFTDNRAIIDSLTKLGYEIHDFDAGFSTINLKDTISNDTTERNSLSYTSLLNQLNYVIPAGKTVYLFAENHLNKFGDKLPEISYKLKWKPLNQTDTLSSWITDYAGKKYEAKSNPSGTFYTTINNEIRPIKISVYETPGNSDKKFLIAALNAIASFSGRQLEINPTGIADVGFWLSDKPVSAVFKSEIDTNGTLFQYKNGKVISETSFINLDGQKVLSNKRIESPTALDKIWTDGFGNTVLARENSANLTVYEFYSRLNPQWNQLVWNEMFVKALMPIVLRNDKIKDFGFENNKDDQRRFAQNQREVIQTNKTSSIINTNHTKSVNYVFWIIAFIILVIERILSFRKKNKVYAKN